MSNIRKVVVLLLLMLVALPAAAQDITIATVTRSPFSMEQDGQDVGFSIDLMNLVATQLGRDVSYLRTDSFSDMLAAVQDGRADAAIANISITAEREQILDFSQPMFDSGIQVMLHTDGNGGSAVLAALFTRQIGLAVLAALVLLFGGGMLMWFFERRHQPYFDKPGREAAFPAFWWALNLVVNGGFEERMPHSRMGRAFAVVLVVSSLFIVSIFVAQITAALTVEAISENVENLNDLDGRQIGTVAGSTTAAFLDARGMMYHGFDDLDTMLAAFGEGILDAVVFDGPILAYYAAELSDGHARVLDRVYRPENYGIAFPTGSPLREEVDRTILQMREDGTFDQLRTDWFGPIYNRR